MSGCPRSIGTLDSTKREVRGRSGARPRVPRLSGRRVGGRVGDYGVGVRTIANHYPALLHPPCNSCSGTLVRMVGRYGVCAVR